MSNFWKQATEGLGSGITLGVNQYENIQRRRDDAEKLRQAQIEKIKTKQASQQALFNLMGVESEADEVTGEVKPKIGASQFDNTNPVSVAQEFMKLDTPERQAYTQYDKMQKPKGISDTYAVPEYRYNETKGTYELWGRNKTSGQYEFIVEDPNKTPDIKDTFTIKGVQEFNGRKIGKRGKVTQVQLLDDNTMKFIETGDITGKNSGKSEDALDFEYNISQWQANRDSIMQRYNKYLAGNFANEQTRDDYLSGINSALNRLAFSVVKKSNPFVKEEVKKIQEQSKQIRQPRSGALPPMTTTEFYETQADSYRELFQNGELSYEDAQRLELFLQYKYRDFVEYADPIKTNSEFQFNIDIPELQEEE